MYSPRSFAKGCAFTNAFLKSLLSSIRNLRKEILSVEYLNGSIEKSKVKFDVFLFSTKVFFDMIHTSKYRTKDIIVFAK